MGWYLRRRIYTFSEGKAFHAMINENTSLMVMKRSSKTIFILKKDLLKYKFDVFATEAPIVNLMGGEEPWESMIISSEVLEKEIFPISDNLVELTNHKGIQLKFIRLCIGANMRDFVTIDESDLVDQGVSPTLEGLKEFFVSHKDMIVGLTVRRYDGRQGNLIFLEAEAKFPVKEISTFKVLILSSLAQRGIYSMKHHVPFGVHAYVIIDCTEITGLVIKLLSKLGVDWSTLILRRSQAIGDWIKVECTLNKNNLRSFLHRKYTSLTDIDIKEIVRFATKNGGSIEAALIMAEIINRQRRREYSRGELLVDRRVLVDIAAAASLAADLCGVEEVDTSIWQVDQEEVERRKKEFLRDFGRLLGLEAEQ
ncbi:MAG: hypothetical protein ACTSXJ_03195 [Candidatus Baldrarchaeia archaeon]